MYNELFLIYVSLCGLSFYTFYQLMGQLQALKPEGWFPKMSGFAGWFLLLNALAIGLMWLSVVIPPLLDGSLYPSGLDHYTTLIVQGFDLAIMLPASFISGWLWLKKKPEGALWTPVYLVFLSLLMLALTAKIIGMQHAGVNTIPAIFIIPCITILAFYCTFSVLRRCCT